MLKASCLLGTARYLRSLMPGILCIRGQRYRARTSSRMPTFWNVGPQGRPALEQKDNCNLFGRRVYKILIEGPLGHIDAAGTPCRFSDSVCRTMGRSHVDEPMTTRGSNGGYFEITYSFVVDSRSYRLLRQSPSELPRQAWRQALRRTSLLAVNRDFTRISGGLCERGSRGECQRIVNSGSTIGLRASTRIDRSMPQSGGGRAGGSGMHLQVDDFRVLSVSSPRSISSLFSPGVFVVFRFCSLAVRRFNFLARGFG
ncbi:hypothetical protein R1flu_013968 [Riccia fluitans]|uniref:PH domain-containing protein n=1 Tax=Riccia fluitans TaxID=41844 RepID=A0ABD1YEW3_9MARC